MTDNDLEPVNVQCARCKVTLVRQRSIVKKIDFKWYCIDCLTSMAEKWLYGISEGTTI